MKKLLLGLALLYSLTLVALYISQDFLIFRPAPLPEGYEFHFDQAFEEGFIEAEDGTRISTLFFPSEGRPKGLVINNHGNRRNIARWGRSADQFTRHGYDVLFYDYRGFGKTKGVPSEEKLLSDAELIYKTMAEKYPENSIILYGRSLGTGVATYLASRHKPKLLLLESPYYHIADVGKMQIPVFPYALLVKHPFRNDQWIEKVNCKVHIFHGTEDPLIPYEASLKLVKKLKQPKENVLTTLQGGTHRGLARFEKYQKKWAELLAQ
jgi:alpha-beta hydrolase superfamily lysophospholipase